ncbi:hypothetical protein [Eshraghiella crossota]
MQNLIENAVKYGNGGYLGIKSEDEEVTAVKLMEAVWDYIYAGKYFI